MVKVRRFKLFDKELLSIKDARGKLSLFGLAIPFFIEQVCTQLLNIISSIMCANYNEGYINGVNVAGTVLSFYTTLLYIVTTGMSILLSIAIGKNDKEKSKNLVGTALFFSVVLGLIITAVGVLTSGWVFRLMNLEESSVAVATEYFNIRIIFMSIVCVTSCITAALRCYGYSVSTIVIGIVTNAVNVGITAVALFDVPFVLFTDKVAGLAYATSIAQVAGLGIAVFMLFFRKIPFTVFKKLKCIGEIVHIGLPGAMALIFYNASNLITTAIIAGVGETVLTAKIYVSQIVVYVAIFSNSVGNANSILMGRLCGLGDIEKAGRMFWHNIRLAILGNLTLSVVVFLLRSQLIGMYTSNPTIIGLSASAFALDIVVEVFRAANHIAERSLNATKDVRYTTVVSIVSCAVNGVGMAYLLSTVLGLGIVGIWLGFIIDEGFRASLYVLRWKKGRWKNKFKEEMRTFMQMHSAESGSEPEKTSA